MGLPVRIVTGTDSAGAKHAWNLASLGGVWYNLDPTWDGKTSSSTRNYFLKGSSSFTGHTPEARYETAEFQAAYPIAGSDYVPTAADDTPVCQFRDVATTAYYYSAVQEMADRGLFNGVNRYTFQPDGTMTRAMLVTVLWRLAGQPEVAGSSVFTDVASDSYYAEAVAWAYEKGITKGVEDTLFAPNSTLTREQLATFLYRYAEKMGYNISASDKLRDFTDVSQASSYAVTALRWAVGAGIIKGISETALSPGGSALRCQMAVMLSRFISYYKL